MPKLIKRPALKISRHRSCKCLNLVSQTKTPIGGGSRTRELLMMPLLSTCRVRAASLGNSATKVRKRESNSKKYSGNGSMRSCGVHAATHSSSTLMGFAATPQFRWERAPGVGCGSFPKHWLSMSLCARQPPHACQTSTCTSTPPMHGTSHACWGLRCIWDIFQRGRCFCAWFSKCRMVPGFASPVIGLSIDQPRRQFLHHNSHEIPSAVSTTR